MGDEREAPLRGRRLLVVEDEYLVATDLTQFLAALGAEVIGPAGSVETALDLLGRVGDGLNGAVLDVNLGGQFVFPVAETLAIRGIPFVFTTGYSEHAISGQFAGVPRCEKPVDGARLVQILRQTNESAGS
jgi:DNA-binding LytR/AlgR family response regulator